MLILRLLRRSRRRLAFFKDVGVIRRSKYGAVKTVSGGIKFDSKAEAARHSVLRLMECAGVISDLKLQVKYDIKINGTQVCTYKADFVYTENGKEVVEDVKGMKTPVYNLKKKMMRAAFGVIIFETGATKKSRSKKPRKTKKR